MPLASSFVSCTHFSALWSNSILHTHLHTPTLTHTSAQADAGLLLGCPSCQAVLLLPGTCHRGDSWLHHQPSPEGNSTLKERHHLSSFHLLTSVISATPFLLSSASPPLSSSLCLSCPHHHHPFSSKNSKGGRRKKSDSVSHLAEIVTHASEHKILPRPSHWPQSKSEEAYLNALFTTVSCSGRRRKFNPFFLLSNKTIVLSVNVCPP